MDGDAMGSHVVGDQLALVVLPRPLALLNAARSAMVSLAGPIAQAKAEGVNFDVAVFLEDVGESGCDAAQVAKVVEVLARHLRAQEAACLLVEEMVEATSEILNRPDVAALAEAITQSLVRRGRISGDGLERILVRHPVNYGVVTVPKELVAGWESRLKDEKQ
jgi:hypothetical protein